MHVKDKKTAVPVVQTLGFIETDPLYGCLRTWDQRYRHEFMRGLFQLVTVLDYPLLKPLAQHTIHNSGPGGMWLNAVECG